VKIATIVLALFVVGLTASTLFARFHPTTKLATHGPEHRVIRVQVLNGSGEGGLGTKVASFLREGGFSVVEVKNADRSDYFGTMVVARREDVAAANAVARYLGSPPVIRQAWSSDLAEVTLVIGSDRSRIRLD
jgi:hypothetical protein